jgi:Sulfotransferase domain
MPNEINLVCIAGTGQNGATLLSRLMGRIPGFVAVGEIGYVWDKALIENVECGCGLPFRECPFWTKVGEEAFGGWDRVDPSEALRLRGAAKLRGWPLAHPLSLLFILRPSIWPRYKRDLAEYSDLMRRLYEGISAVSGKDTIVDSMKRPSHVYMMRDMADVKLRVVHLVRDSRGVAYSNLKWVHRQDSTKANYRTRRPPWKAAGRWMWINVSFHLLRRLGVASTVTRYETFVAEPRTELARIATFAGVRVEDDDLAFINGNEVDLGTDHLVAGNRMRFESGVLRLNVDQEWRAKLTGMQRNVVSALTWPLLRRYGYLG